MTNKELLQSMSELKNDIDAQKQLGSNLLKLKNIDILTLQEIRSNIESAIEKLKDQQETLILRNTTNAIQHLGVEYRASKLIRMKEELTLKLEFESILANVVSDDEKIIRISLEAFQKVQQYKKEIGQILNTLNNYNNQEW